MLSSFLLNAISFRRHMLATVSCVIAFALPLFRRCGVWECVRRGVRSSTEFHLKAINFRFLCDNGRRYSVLDLAIRHRLCSWTCAHSLYHRRIQFDPTVIVVFSSLYFCVCACVFSSYYYFYPFKYCLYALHNFSTKFFLIAVYFERQ